MHFEYSTEYGRGGTDMFQLVSLEQDGKDVTEKVDQGIHFNNEQELSEYISDVFEVPVSDISLERMD
jgi:hypothetical protein